jgi:hypothetical protein
MSIMGKDKGSKEPDGDEAGQTLSGFSNIHIKPLANGIQVSHTPQLPKGVKEYSEKAPEEQIHAFKTAQEAHSHIGGLLGLRLGSGTQKE